MIFSQYSEAVEAKLKQAGLQVDLLFPNEDVPIRKVLSNILSRGCLYAILVTPQNQERRSITVHVLHGQPEEHRNMPVNDAVHLIYENFQNYKDRNLLPKAVSITPTSNYAAPPLNSRHPDAVQTLINLLADNRPITVLQYDRTIRYLQERRELQLKAEIGDAPPDVPIPPPVDPEIELQKKIMDILNKPSITNAVVTPAPQPVVPRPVPAPTPAAQHNNEPQLLNDPKVQKALDLLLQGSFQF